jgi:hypothetical protein
MMALEKTPGAPPVIVRPNSAAATPDEPGDRDDMLDPLKKKGRQ